MSDGPLTVAQVAEYLGLSVRTVETYRADGRLPKPTMVGRTPTWTRAQIDQWQANRPGRGARTDLRGRD
ncbi:MAG: helix-turn-helix domain-containing protein [Dermatophilaceae bacterium]|nr:helix-turn-helix domain-containing protein [Dermatophilaceae bacterium]